MWLLNTSTIELEAFIGQAVPDYAILSHTWGAEEVTFTEIFKKKNSALSKAGYAKIISCCKRALDNGFLYAWIDTCCIDKRSSAELSEAINSMYKYYRNSQICYAYLADVSSWDENDPSLFEESFRKSRWFTRGWTLQELLAPRNIEFCARDWTLIGLKQYCGTPDDFKVPRPLHPLLSMITGIKEVVFDQPAAIGDCSIASRISWAASRETSREEDESYCLMGIFRVNMPILYGEGRTQAFRRLQLEIMRSSDDMSIFAWREDEGPLGSGFLADSPRHFKDSGNIVSALEYGRRGVLKKSFLMTNQGLSITLRLGFGRSPDGINPSCWVMLDNVAIKKDDEAYFVGLHIRLHDGRVYPREAEEDIVCSRKIIGSLFMGERISVDAYHFPREEEFELMDSLAGSYQKLLVYEQEDVYHF